MDEGLKNSHVSRTSSRTNSLLGSFKMGQSMLGIGKNRNVQHLEIKGIQLIGKNQYKKQQQCQICFVGFSKMNRQHHCRVCANAVCSDCSASSINKQRACDVCIMVRSNQNENTELIKGKILEQLKGIAILYVQNKKQAEEELKGMKDSGGEVGQENSQEQLAKFIENCKQRMQKMQQKIEMVKKQRVRVEQEQSELILKND